MCLFEYYKIQSYLELIRSINEINLIIKIKGCVIAFLLGSKSFI